MKKLTKIEQFQQKLAQEARVKRAQAFKLNNDAALFETLSICKLGKWKLVHDVERIQAGLYIVRRAEVRGPDRGRRSEPAVAEWTANGWRTVYGNLPYSGTNSTIEVLV